MTTPTTAPTALCNGICLRAYEVGLPEYGSMIAVAHPDCEEHGDGHDQQ